MIIRNKGYSLLAAALCMAAVSAPAEAWYGGGGGSGRGDLAARLAGAIVPPVALTVVGAMALEPTPGLTAVRLAGVIAMAAPTAVITAMAMAIPLTIAVVTAAVMSRRQVSPVWRLGLWLARLWHLNRLPLLPLW